jgi:hypothetical protein
MKQHIVTFLAAMTAATALVAAQSTQNPPPAPPAAPPAAAGNQERQQTPDVTLTGCLIQGSGPTVFILDKAKDSTADRTAPGQSYVLTSGAESVAFKDHVNHEVSISGTTEAKAKMMPAAGQKAAEKDLPKFTAKTVTMIADKCTAPTQ